MIVWSLSVVIKGRNVPIVTFGCWGECYKHYIDNFQESMWRCDPTTVGLCYFNPEPFITVADKFLEDTEHSEGWSNYQYYQAEYARGINERK